MNNIIIQDPYYPMATLISIGGNKESFIKTSIEFLGDDYDENVIAHLSNKGSTEGGITWSEDGRAVLRIGGNITDDQVMSVLIHEISHLIYAIGVNIGASRTDESDEFYAYMYQFYTNQILDAFNIIKYNKK